MPTEHPDPFEDRMLVDPAERQIREAIQRGEFDHLPGAGKPLPDLGTIYEPGWWARRWLERARAEDAAAEVRRAIARELPFLRSDPDRSRAARRAAELNAVIAALNERLPDGEAVAPVEMER
jgi:DnaJ homologue, subfamily C, member 28, conserved domain